MDLAQVLVVPHDVPITLQCLLLDSRPKVFEPNASKQLYVLPELARDVTGFEHGQHPASQAQFECGGKARPSKCSGSPRLETCSEGKLSILLQEFNSNQHARRVSPFDSVDDLVHHRIDPPPIALNGDNGGQVRPDIHTGPVGVLHGASLDRLRGPSPCAVVVVCRHWRGLPRQCKSRRVPTQPQTASDRGDSGRARTAPSDRAGALWRPCRLAGYASPANLAKRRSHAASTSDECVSCNSRSSLME